MSTRNFRTQAERNAYDLGQKDAAKPDSDPLTLEEVRKMSVTEVTERLPEVEEVLRNSGDGEAA